jgi:CRP-like cAMP-binding protein
LGSFILPRQTRRNQGSLRVLDKNSIRNNYLVYGLTDDQLGSVAALANERNLMAGEVLCRQGEVGGELFIVLDGELSVETAEGERLASVGPNSVVGEMGLVDTRPRSATVVASQASRVAAIRSSDLREEMVTDGHLGFLVLCNITRVLSDRLRHADAKLDALMETSIREA